MTEPGTARVPAPAHSPEDDAEVTPTTAPVDSEPLAGPRLLGLSRLMWPVAIVAALGGLTVAVVGFALSYRTLVHAAQTWDFGHYGARAFPLGVDGAILAFYAWDLILVHRKMPKPLLRWAAHGMTLVTVVLNVDAAAGGLPGNPSVWSVLAQQPGRLLSHASMPLVFVLIVEGLRHLITRTARLERGGGTLEPAAWVLNTGETWAVFRTAKLWDLPYDVVREQRRELAIHRVWHDHREAIESGEETAAVLAELLSRHGVSVEDALALPDKMRRAEQQREQQAEAERRQLAHEARLAALETERAELAAAGEVEVLRAQVEGEQEAAAHRARAAVGTAAVEAEAATRAAERAATEAERRAAAEAEAEESAAVAAARRKAAEDDAAALATETANARRREELAETERRTKESARAAKRAEAERAEAERDATRARQETAERREAIARAELAARAAEDVAGLGERERNVRRVARMILTTGGGDPNRVPLGAIETELGVANGTASTYRNAAIALIGEGYDHRQDPLHAADAAVRR